jgi:NAD(P)-dependent dehydrogenase (short-subunit alcohol dehydrogenase family)
MSGSASDVKQGPGGTGGPRFGARSTAMEVAAAADLRGKTALITGASSGIGVETARALAAAGADIVLAVRTVAPAEATAEDIRRAWGRQVRVVSLDLSDVASVVALAESIGPTLPALDLLIANAGVSQTPDWHTPNGLDVRFATNHLGHFLLAHLMYPKLAERGARIVVLSSAAHKGRPIQLDDLQHQARPRDDFRAYGESKTANILFAMEATRRWSGDGVFANAVMPGSIMTGLQRYHTDEVKRRIGFIQPDGSMNPVMKTVEQGAATTVWGATAPELEGLGGLVLENCGQALPVGPDTHPWSGYDPEVMDKAAAVRLWDKSLEILTDLGVAV